MRFVAYTAGVAGAAAAMAVGAEPAVAPCLAVALGLYIDAHLRLPAIKRLH